MTVILYSLGASLLLGGGGLALFLRSWRSGEYEDLEVARTASCSATTKNRVRA
jgi:cbb3-type cytochrome oxidase maturation protein